MEVKVSPRTVTVHMTAAEVRRALKRSLPGKKGIPLTISDEATIKKFNTDEDMPGCTISWTEPGQ